MLLEVLNHQRGVLDMSPGSLSSCARPQTLLVDESRHSCATLSIKRIKEGLQTKYLADLTNHVF